VRHDLRVLLLALLAGTPAVLATAWLSGRAGLPTNGRVVLLAVVVLVWVLAALLVQLAVVRPLQTMANVLAALREGDFSFRARSARPDDALGLALHEANLLTAVLRDERLRALESAALLRRVMAEIDVAVFAFDEAGRLRLVNRQGERLLARPSERLLGETSTALALDDLLADGGAARGGVPTAPRVLQASFPGGTGRWEVRRGEFRQGGRPHALLLVTDLSETLRAEERQAWQRLVRVLSHEINNSLAPIKTIAGSLLRRVRGARERALRGAPAAPALPAATGAALPPTASGVLAAYGSADDDFAHGLGVIAERAESLGRFIGAYARLTRLPAPTKRAVEVDTWVRRVATLESRVPLAVRGGPKVIVPADADQLDQLLINLLRNAADAACETEGGVVVWWDAPPGLLRLFVDDEGPGLAETANLFVPFYSTKQEGSGIGLALCRQIVEGHGGAITLENRPDRRGARATVTLPR
jgi:nitrogen fixation/metabolism regulation signal transduction histidine kinase